MPELPERLANELAPVLRILRREARNLEGSLAALREPLFALAERAVERLPALQAGQPADPLIRLLPVVHRATLAIEEVFTELEDRADPKQLRRHAGHQPSPGLVEAVQTILAELERKKLS